MRNVNRSAKFPNIAEQSPLKLSQNCQSEQSQMYLGGGWAEPKNGAAILGHGLAVRCSQSEHGESQLSINKFCLL
ncbi:MAG: hypothetical protein LBI82_08290 [Dysgonamonadaceae bacterium]|nr:hypothetical protein [Dysgonamonadaceae bacterium]